MMSSVMWRTTPYVRDDAQDVDCPKYDQFLSDPGCQVMCTDDNCTFGWRVLFGLQKAGVAATHLSINCCAPYSGCAATVKSGINPLSNLPGDACERRCAAIVSPAYYKLKLSRHVPLCGRYSSSRSGVKPRKALSRLTIVGNYMHATNIAIDFRKS